MPGTPGRHSFFSPQSGILKGIFHTRNTISRDKWCMAAISIFCGSKGLESLESCERDICWLPQAIPGIPWTSCPRSNWDLWDVQIASAAQDIPNWLGSSLRWQNGVFGIGKQSSCNVELKRHVWGFPLLKYQVLGYPVQAVCPSCAGIMLTRQGRQSNALASLRSSNVHYHAGPCHTRWTWENARRTKRQKDQKTGKKVP